MSPFARRNVITVHFTQQLFLRTLTCSFRAYVGRYVFVKIIFMMMLRPYILVEAPPHCCNITI